MGRPRVGRRLGRPHYTPEESCRRPRIARLLTFDLLQLCWDDEKGKPHWRCSSGLATGIGGALLLDAVLAEAVTIDAGRATTTGRAPDDPLLAQVVTEVEGRRRPPKPKALVGRLGTSRRLRGVRERMVREGVLQQRRVRVLGIVPVTRRPPADPSQAEELRERIRALLRGDADPEHADDDDVILASLAGATGAVAVLVERGERKAARRRAEGFRDGTGVSQAVSDAIREAQAAVAAAVAASGAAGGASS